jgi:hypothetical protein
MNSALTGRLLSVMPLLLPVCDLSPGLALLVLSEEQYLNGS